MQHRNTNRALTQKGVTFPENTKKKYGQEKVVAQAAVVFRAKRLVLASSACLVDTKLRTINTSGNVFF